MDANMNGPLSPERPDDEELPLVPLSPDLDRRQRAKALSQLSLQSQGSVDYDVTDAVDDDEPVSLFLLEISMNISTRKTAFLSLCPWFCESSSL